MMSHMHSNMRRVKVQWLLYVPPALTFINSAICSHSVVTRFIRSSQWIMTVLIHSGSWDSVVSVATCYGLEGPGIESQWDEIFRTYPDWLWGPPSLLYNGYWVFSGGKGGRGVMLTAHPFLVPRLRVELYLHSPYGSSWACYMVPFFFTTQH
jgi:hypothetical protein